MSALAIFFASMLTAAAVTAMFALTSHGWTALALVAALVVVIAIDHGRR